MEDRINPEIGSSTASRDRSGNGIHFAIAPPDNGCRNTIEIKDSTAAVRAETNSGNSHLRARFAVTGAYIDDLRALAIFALPVGERAVSLAESVTCAARVKLLGNVSRLGKYGHLGSYREIWPIKVISVNTAPPCPSPRDRNHLLT